MDYVSSSSVTRSNASDVPLLSIIIVNYETKGLLKYCLKRLFASSLPKSTEVIVVDNASKDGSAEWLTNEELRMKNHADHSLRNSLFVIHNSRNVGFGAGNNEGIRRARGKYCFLMNPDIVIHEGALQHLLAFLDEHPKAAAVGPRLTHPDGTLQHSRFRFPDVWIPLYRRTPLGRFAFARRAIDHYCMSDVDHTKPHKVDWLLGAAILARRSAIERAGLMDERYFLYFEDIDWCRRFWKEGFEVWYEPKAMLTHFHQRLSAEATGLHTLFSFATRAHIASGIKYFLKWGIRNNS
ncbi:MAG: glycosyltransferase family 2 protein [bacterium]|nr:glycosyltransferase family 2 protein [bacterium]